MTMEAKKKREKKNAKQKEPYRLRIPGFLVEFEIGLGDVIKRATGAVGIKPCGGCLKRADALNQWVSFSRKRT